MAFWINIYGSHPHPRRCPLSVKQLKNDSYRQALYLFNYFWHNFYFTLTFISSFVQLGRIKRVLNNIYFFMIQVCHQDEHSHKEVCQYEDHEKCHEEHKEICDHHDVKIPHHDVVKVPEKVCHYQKHSSYSGHRSHSNLHSGHSGFRTSGHNFGHNSGHHSGHHSGHNFGHNSGHHSGHNSGHNSGHHSGSSHIGRQISLKMFN